MSLSSFRYFESFEGRFFFTKYLSCRRYRIYEILETEIGITPYRKISHCESRSVFRVENWETITPIVDELDNLDFTYFNVDEIEKDIYIYMYAYIVTKAENETFKRF